MKNNKNLKVLGNEKKVKSFSKIAKVATPKNELPKKVAPKKEEPEELTDEQKQEIRDSLTRQLVAREYAPVSHDTLSKSITYVTAGNGLFKVRKTPIAIFKEQIAEIRDENLGLPDMEEGVELAIPKLPFRYLIEILSYYRDINEMDKTEASVLFFYNDRDVELPDVPGMRQEGKIITYVPEQENSPTLSDFKDDETVHWLRENTSLLLETHSHQQMGAFFSGTDDANENNTQFYAVWGKVEDAEPEIAFRYVVGDSKVTISPTVLFEWPILEEVTTTQTIVESMIHGESDLVDIDSKKEISENEPKVEKEFLYIKGPFKQIEYPEEWLDQHTKYVPVRTIYNHYGGYGGYQAGKQRSHSPYGANYNNYGAHGGAEQLSFADIDAFGSGDTYDYLTEEDGPNFDELNNLSIYLNNNFPDVVSPELENGIRSLLEQIRLDYPSVYEELGN